MKDSSVRRPEDWAQRRAGDSPRRQAAGRDSSRRTEALAGRQPRPQPRRQASSSSASGRSRSRSRSRRRDRRLAPKSRPAAPGHSRRRPVSPRTPDSSRSPQDRQQGRLRRASPQGPRRDRQSPPRPPRRRQDSQDSEDSASKLLNKLQKKKGSSNPRENRPTPDAVRRPVDAARPGQALQPPVPAKLQTFVAVQSLPGKPHRNGSSLARPSPPRRSDHRESLEAAGQLLSRRRVGTFDIVELQLPPQSRPQSRVAPLRSPPGVSCHLRDRIVKRTRETDLDLDSRTARPQTDIIARIKKRQRE